MDVTERWLITDGDLETSVLGISLNHREKSYFQAMWGSDFHLPRDDIV